MGLRFALIFLLCLPMAAPIAHAEELSVAAAADLTYCIPEIDAAFEKANPGAVVKLSLGSSGNFFEEIKNGAPFDVFLSADMQYPKELAKAGLVEEPVKYAEGRIVLWTMDAGLDLSRGLAALRDAGVKHVALANPDHAPYGRAAKAALEHEHRWDELTPKYVYGESVAQTAQFVQTGNAEAGFVALSLVKAPKFAQAGHFYEVPAEDYPVLEQAAAVTKAGSGKALAAAYVAFLKSDEGRGILERFGFQLPK